MQINRNGVTKAARNPGGMDDETAAALFKGLTISQLSRLFEMDRRDLQAKIAQHSIEACGVSDRGYPLYKLKMVMPAVVKPLYDVEAYLRNMNPSELPKTLTKEYWAAMRSRQEFELKDGNLWPTEKVVEEVSELFKLMDLNLKLLLDTVERNNELTEAQRKVIKDVADGTRMDLHRMVTEKFSSKNRKQQHVEEDDEEL